MTDTTKRPRRDTHTVSEVSEPMRQAFRSAMPERNGAHRYCVTEKGWHDDDDDEIAWTACDSCLNQALTAALRIHERLTKRGTT